MRKALYGTTALVSIGIGQAQAASALKLGITGWYRNSIGAQVGNSPGATTAGGSFVRYGDSQRQTASMRQDIRVNFTGETKLDNGITVGVLVGLTGENVEKSGSDQQFYYGYGYFSGTFGQIRIGETDSALVTNCVLDPGNVTWNFGINSPWESYSNVGRSVPLTVGQNPSAGSSFGVGPVGSVGTCYGIETLGNKLEYFSPIVGGFSFAVSFAPQGNSRLAGGLLAPGTNLRQDPVDDVLSAYGNYNHTFQGWSLTAGLGGEWAFASYTTGGASAGNKPAMYSTGLQVGIGSWKLGAAAAYYQNYSKDGYAATFAAPSDDGWVVVGGGNYSIGQWQFGLQGMYSLWQELGDTTHEAIWGVSLNGIYAFTSSFSIDGQIAYTYADYGNVGLGGTSIPNVHGLEFDLGTDIDF